MKEGLSGVTTNTPKNIMFGAGTIHKGLKYAEGSGWNFAESLMGATNGGSTLTITPEFYNVPVDGANVAIKELVKKVGEVANLAINFAELKEDLVTLSTIAEVLETSEDEVMNLIQSKADIAEGDFLENIAFVGVTLEGKKIIAILENALCTSGLPLGGTNRESATVNATFTCHTSIEKGNLDTLPWKIYYPKATV